MTPEERQRYVEAALRAGREHLPRLSWKAYGGLAGAYGQLPNDGVHVSLDWRPDRAMGVGMWECHVYVRNCQMAEFKGTSPGGAVVDARNVIDGLRNLLVAVLRPKRARRQP